MGAVGWYADPSYLNLEEFAVGAVHKVEDIAIEASDGDGHGDVERCHTVPQVLGGLTRDHDVVGMTQPNVGQHTTMHGVGADGERVGNAHHQANYNDRHDHQGPVFDFEGFAPRTTDGKKPVNSDWDQKEGWDGNECRPAEIHELTGAVRGKHDEPLSEEGRGYEEGTRQQVHHGQGQHQDEMCLVHLTAGIHHQYQQVTKETHTRHHTQHRRQLHQLVIHHHSLAAVDHP